VRPAAAGPGTAALLVGLIGWGGGRTAAAEGVVKVSVVRPALGDEALIEVATRAWAELSADGVQAALVDDAPRAAGAVAPPAPGDATAALTVTTYRRAGETVTDLELTVPARADVSIRRTVVIAREPAEPKLLAIRAVELVHGALLEAQAAFAREEAPAAVVAAVDDESPGEPRPPGQPLEPPRWAVGTGVSLFGSAGGLGSGFGGVLRAGYRPPHDLGVSLLVGAAAFGGAVPTARGALSLEQALAAVELTYPGFDSGRVRPEIALGAGVYHASAAVASAVSQPPASAVSQPPTGDSFWALALSGGPSIAAELLPYLELFVDARLMVAYPHPVAPARGGGTLAGADPALIVSLGAQRTF
jgi:hypothetical protein